MLTIDEAGVAQLEIKKSIFSGYAYFVSSQNKAMEIINELKTTHKKAAHICYAYILNDNIEKFDDDGEPSFTAGKPIYEVIKKQNLKNVLVAVVRYFGGIKLGAARLAGAYSKIAVLTLNNSKIVNEEKFSIYEINISYENYDTVIKIMQLFKNIKIIKVNYLDNVKIEFAIRCEENNLNEFKNKIRQLKYTISFIKEKYLKDN